MKLIKVQPDYFVVVDNSEVKVGDWYYSSKNVVARMTEEMLDYYTLRNLLDTINKITHSTKELNGVKTLSLSEVKEAIGEVDVDRLAAKIYPYEVGYGVSNENTRIGELQDAYANGYNQCLQDNKDKIYTDSDIRRVVLFSRAIHNDSLSSQQIFEEVMLHIQPRTQWDVQFVDDELRLI